MPTTSRRPAARSPRRQAALAWLALAPRLGVFVFAVLTVRAILGLLPRSLLVRPSLVGVQEIGYSLLTVVGLAAGLRGGW